MPTWRLRTESNRILKALEARMHHYTPKSLKKIVGIAPSCGCPHRPPHAMRPVCEPFWSRVFCGLCGWARTSGLRLPKPAVYQLTLHTDWNPLSWGWRGLHPQRAASVAGAGNVSLVLHGVAHRCHLRCNIPHILQASFTWTSAPESRLNLLEWAPRVELG